MANDTPNPGDIEINKLLLINFNNTETWDLKRMCVEFNIYEDISQHFIRGDMIIEDSLALMTRLPIIGEEILDLKVRTPAYDKTKYAYKYIEGKFRVVACRRLTTMQQVRKVLYKLEFYPIERFFDLSQTIGDAMGPTKISDMVKRVGKNYLNLTDKLSVEETAGDHKFVIPLMSPFETMTFLAGEAKSNTYAVTNFFYYQTHFGSNFRSVEDLLFNGKIKEVYYVTPKNVTLNNSEFQQASAKLDAFDKDSQIEARNPYDFRSMISIEFSNNFNVEEGMKMGMYDNIVRTIDPLLQQFDTVKVGESDWFNYHDAFYDFSHTYKGRKRSFPTDGDRSFLGDSFRLVSEDGIFSKLFGESHMRYLVTNEKQLEHDARMRITPRARPSQLPWTISFAGQFRSIVCNLCIPGDSERIPGDVIYFDIHEFGATKDVEAKLNEYISGAYFVTGVRHKYTREAAMRYTTFLTCIKNSYEKEIKNAPGKAQPISI